MVIIACQLNIAALIKQNNYKSYYTFKLLFAYNLMHLNIYNSYLFTHLAKDSFLSASLHAHNESDIATVRANTSKLDSLPVSGNNVCFVFMST